MVAALVDDISPMVEGKDLETLLGLVTAIGDQLATSPTIDDAIRVEVSGLLPRLHPGAPNQAFPGDPALAVAVFAGSLRSTAALGMADGRAARRELRLAIEQTRQALRSILEDEPASDERNVHEVLAWLDRALEVTQPELADLLGTSPRTLSRWLSGDADPGTDHVIRIRRLAALVNQLRHLLSAPGAARWLARQSGRRGPLELLDSADGYRTLLSRARSLRSLPAD